MPRAGFEPAIPAAKRPQTYGLDRAATGIGNVNTHAPVNTRTSPLNRAVPANPNSRLLVVAPEQYALWWQHSLANESGVKGDSPAPQGGSYWLRK
jgi:hypothetical protein